MRSRILGTLAGAAALLMSVALVPVASAGEDCTKVSPPTGGSDKQAARLGLLRPLANATKLADAQADFLGGDTGAFDKVFYNMLCLAANWQEDGPARGGDLNPKYNSSGEVIEPRIDENDALIMYYSYVLTSDMTAAGPTGQANRSALLAGRIGTGPTGNDITTFTTANQFHAEYQKLVVRALRLRCDVDTNFTHAWCSDTLPTGVADPSAAFGSF